jgi:hypothetical protein
MFSCHITYKYKILTFSSNFVMQIYVSILNTIFCKGPCNPNHGQFLVLLSNKVDTGITSHHLLCHAFLNLQLLNHKIETTKSTVHLLLLCPVTWSGGGAYCFTPVRSSHLVCIVCPVNSSYSFWARPFILCRQLVLTLKVCIFYGFWLSQFFTKLWMHELRQILLNPYRIYGLSG